MAKSKDKSNKDEVVKKKKKPPAEEVEKGFNPYAQYNEVLDEVARKLNDADTLDDMEPMSTGSLCLDVILGGGIRAAWYTNFGPEQSAKTTSALKIMAGGIKANVPIMAFRDFEGSTGNSTPYVLSILRTEGIKMSKAELWGKKDPVTGKWLVPPRVRYNASTRGVSFFNWFAALLSRLPDKKLLDREWWLVYERTKENEKSFGKFHVSGMDKKYGQGIYIKAPDGGLQGLIVLDSYPNMNPDYKDEDKEDNSLALQARMFSKNLPRVKGYLAAKKVAVVGVNQLRDVPMAMFGPKESEPGGKALRYNSDARLKYTPRALSVAGKGTDNWWVKEHKKKKGFEVEGAVGGGEDMYRYIHVKAIKNKLSESDREGLLRLWVKDSEGIAHGIDPVFDTMQYLRQTGQLKSKNRGHMELVWEGKTYAPLTWDQFKMWILGDKEVALKASKKIGLKKPMMLRKACFKQVASGETEKLLALASKAKPSSSDEDDDDEED
jgi:RecA/RadA recombinase